MFNYRFLTLIVSMLVLAAGVAAQSAAISGIVQDPANARVAGATVVLRNVRSGSERVAVSDGEGGFSFNTDGPPGLGLRYENL